MKFAVASSLRTRALTTVSAVLWNSHDARKFISSIFHSVPADSRIPFDTMSIPAAEKWAIGRSMIGERAQNLDLPESLKYELSRFVDAMGFEILRWFHFHIRKYELIKKIPPAFVWTAHGTIDSQKTAYALLQDETIDIVDRFKLACLYCVEEYVFSLWAQLDQESRYMMHRIYDGFDIFLPIQFWCSYIKTKIPLTYPWASQGYTFYEGFQFSLETPNEVGAKFFFSRSADKKNKQIVKDLTEKIEIVRHKQKFPIPLTTSNKQYAEILCFVLNSMMEDQQIEILKKITLDILTLFLEWPFQDQFIKLHRHIGHFLSGGEFLCLLERVLKKPETGCKDYDYEKIFVQLWVQAPLDHRKHVHFSRSSLPFLLSSLCNIQYWTAFNQILKDVTPDERKKLLFCGKLCTTYQLLISAEKWNSVKNFVMKCLFNKQEVIEFRNRVNYRSSRDITFGKFVEVNKIIDEYLGYTKRPTEDCGNEPKKLCVAEL